MLQNNSLLITITYDWFIDYINIFAHLINNKISKNYRLALGNSLGRTHFEMLTQRAKGERKINCPQPRDLWSMTFFASQNILVDMCMLTHTQANRSMGL